MSDLMNRPMPITTGRVTPPAPPAIKGPATAETDFSRLLRQSLQVARPKELVFSKHAQVRAVQRGLEFSPEDLHKLELAVDLAREKGITDSLIYLNETAFIVNIPNKVVVTVVDSEEPQNNVFTNINGAVIL